MQKMILAIAALFLVATASVFVCAQSTEKKEEAKPTARPSDVWRPLSSTGEQTSTPVIVIEEPKYDVEVRETEGEIETRILDLERKLLEAFKQRDSVVLKELLADDFLSAGAGLTESQSEKTRFIERTLKNSELKTNAVEKIRVRVYSAATAIVTTYYKQQKVIAGISTNVDFTATDVWVRRKKQWQAVSRHVTELSKAAPVVSRPTQIKQTP